MNIEIEKLLMDNQELHSEFQIDNFIIGNQGDKWAQYKQCLREISGRVENIKNKKEELKLLKLNLEKWRIFWPTKYHIKKRKLEKQQALNRIKYANKIIVEYERELSSFLSCAIKLKKQIGEVTPERRQQLEAESWMEKGRKMIAIDMIMGGLRSQTIEFMLSLPKGEQELFKILESKQTPKKLLGME